jgi:hypothetical protein
MGLAENLDQAAAMRKLAPDQQLLVEFRPLRVREIWVTIDHLKASKADFEVTPLSMPGLPDQ